MSLQEQFEKVKIVKNQLEELGISDPELLHDTLEGETDIFELLDWMLNKEAEENSNQEAIKIRQEQLAQRKKASEARQVSMRNLIEQTAILIGEKKIKRAEATISISDKKPSILNVDLDILPEKYIRIKKEADRTAINEAIKSGEIIEGVVLSNGGITLSIRR